MQKLFCDVIWQYQSQKNETQAGFGRQGSEWFPTLNLVLKKTSRAPFAFANCFQTVMMNRGLQNCLNLTLLTLISDLTCQILPQWTVRAMRFLYDMTKMDLVDTEARAYVIPFLLPLLCRVQNRKPLVP